jgi:ppGpp synthetase/RelA/SpoT-type nucleotidyltranferase
MAQRFTLAKAKAFLEQYEVRRPLLKTAAAELHRYLSHVLSDANIAAHMVSVRVKEIDSVRGKLLRKGYADPDMQLTDVIGARIILYHGSEVDRVAKLLRTHLKVRERDSADKRLALGLREFGYRSYHLIGEIPRNLRSRRNLDAISAQPFEIQVRSILEHVWAEIEHSVAYKSGADLPSALKRRFASLAAVLEMLEHEFSGVAAETEDLIEFASQAISAKPLVRRTLDVPVLLATLEVSFPAGLSFRNASSAGSAFPPGIEQRFLLAFQRLGVGSTSSLVPLLRSAAFGVASRRYASYVGVARSELSHLAVLAIALGVKSRDLLTVFFPEFSADTALGFALTSKRSG